MDTAQWAKLPVTVTVVEALGGETLVYGHIGVAIPDDSPIGAAAEDTAEGKGPTASKADPRSDTIIIKAPADFEAHSGEVIQAAVNLGKLHLFDGETEASIKPRIPTENICPCEVTPDTLSFAGQRFPLPPALREYASPAKAKIAPPPHIKPQLTLPADALLLGTGSGRAQVAEAETFTDGEVTRALYRLTVGGEVIFAAEAGEPRFLVGDTLPFDVDFSRVTVEAYGIIPLPAENTLSGRFTKEKELDEKGRKVYRFYLEMEDMPIPADPKLCEKLFSCKGTAIFKTPLSFRFPPDAVTVTPRGGENEKTALPGRVTKTLDYGRVTYAEVDVGGKTVIAPCSGKAGEAVAVTVDQERLTVVDAEVDIIIV